MKKGVKLPPEARASLLFGLCSVLQKGVAFLVVPVYTRLMSAQEYGQYTVFISWYQFLMIFTTLNMWNYLINNGLTEFGLSNKWRFISSLQGLSTTITFAWFLVYLLFFRAWEDMTGLSLCSMLLMFAELFMMPSFEYWCAVKRYEYKAGAVVIMTLIQTVLIPLISIPLICTTHQKGMAAITGRVAGSLIVFFAIFLSLLIRERHWFDGQMWRYALRFNLPLIPHFLSMMVLQQSDRIMIERLCGKADAAIYAIAYQLGMALFIVNSAILNSFIPYTYKELKEGRESNVAHRAVIHLVLIGLMNMMAVLLAPEIIHILAPEEYYNAVYIVPLVAMSNLYMFLFNLFANIEYYFKETKFVAVASIGSALVNIMLNAFFIPRYGFIAAGYTTLACYIMLSIGHYVFMRLTCRKHMGGRRVYDMKKIAGITLSFTILAFAVVFLYRACFQWLRYAFLVGLSVILWINRRKIISIREK